MSIERYLAGRRPWSRLMTVAGLLLVLASIVTSVFATQTLGTVVRIRWSVGTYYGPESVPTDPVMLAVPVAIAGIVLVGRWLGRAVTDGDRSSERRLLFDALATGVGALLVATQLLVVVLNL